MDAIDLFIGSEGTLGIVTEITLKLDNLPENVLGGIAFFDNIDNLLGFVNKVRDSSRKYDYTNINVREHRTKSDGSIDARTLEFFDANSLRLLKENYSQIPDRAVGAIWFEQEYEKEFENEVMEVWYNTISEFTELSDVTWTGTNPKEHNMLREFRHTLPEKVFEIIVKNKTLKIGTDTAVPDCYIESYYKFITERINHYRLQHYIWGHIGNSHFHANVIVKTEDEVNKGYTFYDECIDEAIRLGGTVSAEHGIGKLKKKYFCRMYNEEIINKMKEIKKIFDPYNILNVGNLFE